VHSVAVRMSCDAHAANDVTQSVFVVLAQNASQLTDRPALAGWLHGTARNLAAKAVRSDVRRRAREQEAAAMNELLSANPDVSWECIAPHLDDALGELSETDREALLLRYFKNHDLRTVGATLGIGDDAAQKRVSRAVERLREFFTKRGVTVGAGGLVVVISANAVQAAPVGLAVTISTAAALAGTTIVTATATAKAAITTMSIFNAKAITAIVASGLIAGTGTFLVHQREAGRLRGENEKLAAAQQKLVEERNAAWTASTANSEELERARRERIELLRLRNEIGTLRARAKDLANLENQIGQLQSSLESANQTAQKAEADAEAEQQRETAIAKMNDAKQVVLGLMLYASDNQNQLPTDFSLATNYWGDALTGTNQFELVIQGSLQNVTNAGDTIAIREREPFFVNGKWFKAYGFADGHSEIKTEPPEGFEAWEKQHMLAPLKNP